MNTQEIVDFFNKEENYDYILWFLKNNIITNNYNFDFILLSDMSLKHFDIFKAVLNSNLCNIYSDCFSIMRQIIHHRKLNYFTYLLNFMGDRINDSRSNFIFLTILNNHKYTQKKEYFDMLCLYLNNPFLANEEKLFLELKFKEILDKIKIFNSIKGF